MSVVVARPVVFRIADELFERLQRLAAGYSDFVKVSEVIRPTRLGGYVPKHLQIVLNHGENVVVPELMIPGNPPAIARTQTFNILCHLMPSEKDTTPYDEYCTVFAAAIVEAVTVDDSWWTMGQLAILSEFGDVTKLDGIEQCGGVNVPLTVTYRTDETNIYNWRA